MTTIAYRNGVMASDSGVWVGDCNYPWARKVARGKDGTLYGVAGNAAQAHAFLDAVDEGQELPKAVEDKQGNSSFSVLVARPGAKGVEIIRWDGVEKYPGAEYFALGAGACCALGAMYCGASAEQAITAAIAHAEGAVGPVQAMRAEPPRGSYPPDSSRLV